MYKEVVDFIKATFNVADQFIPLHEPRFIGNEKEYVMDCIDSTFVSSVGKYVNLFEDKIKDFTGAKYAIATTNGSAALHLSLVLAGVKRDELVITQPLTFIATCNAISYIGAEPLFIDVDLNTKGLSPSKLEDFLKDKTNRLIMSKSLPILEKLKQEYEKQNIKKLPFNKKIYEINKIKKANNYNPNKNQNIVFIDPGKRTLLYMMSQDGLYYRYNNKRRLAKTKRLKYNKLL